MHLKARPNAFSSGSPPTPYSSSSFLSSPTTVSVSRLIFVLLLLLLLLTTLGKFPAFIILALPLVTFFGTFIEGTDASLSDLCDAFLTGAFVAPPILLAAESVLALCLALLLFGPDETSALLLLSTTSSSSSSSSGSLLGDRLVQALSEENLPLLYFSAFCFLVTGLAEESLKLFLGTSLCSGPVHTHSRKLLWTCGAVGFGLAFGESVVAVVSLQGDGARGALERVATAQVAHVACAVWSAARLARGLPLARALGPSLLAHGLFDLGLVLMAATKTPKWASFAITLLGAGSLARTAMLDAGRTLDKRPALEPASSKV